MMDIISWTSPESPEIKYSISVKDLQYALFDYLNREYGSNQDRLVIIQPESGKIDVEYNFEEKSFITKNTVTGENIKYNMNQSSGC
jgi:hypothetical protein